MVLFFAHNLGSFVDSDIAFKSCRFWRIKSRGLTVHWIWIQMRTHQTICWKPVSPKSKRHQNLTPSAKIEWHPKRISQTHQRELPEPSSIGGTLSEVTGLGTQVGDSEWRTWQQNRKAKLLPILAVSVFTFTLKRPKWQVHTKSNFWPGGNKEYHKRSMPVDPAEPHPKAHSLRGISSRTKFNTTLHIQLPRNSVCGKKSEEEKRKDCWNQMMPVKRRWSGMSYMWTVSNPNLNTFAWCVMVRHQLLWCLKMFSWGIGVFQNELFLRLVGLAPLFRIATPHSIKQTQLGSCSSRWRRFQGSNLQRCPEHPFDL